MRKLLLILCLLMGSLSLQAQQNKTASTQKAKTATAPAKPKAAAAPKSAPAQKASTTTPQKAATPQKTTPQKAATPQKTAAPQKTTAPQKAAAKPAQKQAAPAGKKTVPTTKDIQKLQNEHASLQKQIKDSEAQLRNTNRDVESQLANLAVITGRISTQKTYVSGIQAEVDTLTRNISILGNDLTRLEKELDDCKRKYSHASRYMYRTRLTQNKLMFIFSAKDFRQMYRRIRYAQEYTKYQRAQGLIIKNKEEAIVTKKDELQKSSSEKRKLVREGRKEQAVLEGQQRERQTVVDQLNKKKLQLQSTIANQQAQSRQLNNRIDQLVQIEIKKAEERRLAEERRKAEEKRKQQIAQSNAAKKEAEKNKTATIRKANTTAPAKNNAPATAKADTKKKGKETTPAKTSTAKTNDTPSGYTAPDNSNHKLSSNFAANQGKLPVPITGSYVISAHFGPYSPEGLAGVTLDNKGTDYSGRPGAQARCVFDGEVTSVFNLGGTTNVIVRHGSYISVYCNLSSSNVHVGQKVTTRQILGPVARDASGNATLHFQLRKETAKLNPEGWIGR